MQNKGKKGITNSKLIHKFGLINDVVELKSSLSSGNLDSSIHNVMECMCTLDDVDEGFNLHHVAVHIFQNREKIEMFVVLEKPHLQLMFLRDEETLLGGCYFSA
jgi:hypothetical protein